MLRAMLSVISAAGSAKTATDLQAPGAELARQSPHKLADCPHIVSITLARRTELKLNWMDALPNADKLCTALCLRQDLKCDESLVQVAMGNWTKMGVHSCIEEPGGNEAGHEGVCAFRFLMDNYHRPWRGVYFTHGDVHLPKHRGYICGSPPRH